MTCAMFAAESVDVALLYGVLPFPTLALDRLLPQMHRASKPGGLLAVWLFPVSFMMPEEILPSSFFTDKGKKDRVSRFLRFEHP